MARKQRNAPEPGARPAPRPPTPHVSGARPPQIPADRLPQHVAIVMDGNGRWAKQRNLPRTDGHARGEESLFDVIEGAIEVGVRYLSAYAFSTENWSRSPDEVRATMSAIQQGWQKGRSVFDPPDRGRGPFQQPAAASDQDEAGSPAESPGTPGRPPGKK